MDFSTNECMVIDGCMYDIWIFIYELNNNFKAL